MNNQLRFNLFDEENQDTIVEGDLPDLPEQPITKLGDIWQLGNHRLMCGDSTDADSVARLMDGKKADMVFTDPPYGMNLDTDFSTAKAKLKFYTEKGCNGQGNKYDRVIGDNEDFTPNLINTIFENFNYCKEIFTWGADYYAELLPNKNDGCWIVWDKRSNDNTFDDYIKQSDKMFGSCFELCCAIGDDTIDGKPYNEIVEIARNFIESIGGFEKFAEWGLF